MSSPRQGSMFCYSCARDVVPVTRDGTPCCPDCGSPLAVGSAAPRRYSVEELLERSGPYKVRERIASGGMGSVYRAFDTELEREVAIKVLLAGSGAADEDVQRFRREASAAARLRHSNIVSIHAVGEVDGSPYIVMDYIDGENLADLIEAGAVSPRRALDVVEQIADALHYAHLRGVVHRDLKPANIIIDSLGRAQLTDFGLAKRLDEKVHLTHTGTTMGTPAYMAPEQAEGLLEEIDAQSDVYGLGAVFYEILTGKPPFEGDNTMSILIDVIEEDPPLPRSVNPRINSDVETICLTAMAKSKRRRYPTALALAEDIRRFKRGEAIEARPVGFLSRTMRRVARSWPVLLTVTIAVAAVAVVVGVFYIRSGAQAQRLAQDRLHKAQTALDESRRFLRSGDDRAALNSALEAKAFIQDLDGVDAAIDAARKANRIRKAAHYLDLARTYLNTGKFDVAEAMFDLVLSEFDPQNDEAARGLRLARGTGSLTVKTVPAGALVVLVPAAADRSEAPLGLSPLDGVDIEMGRYCLRIEPEGRPSQNVSFEVGRSESVSLSVELPPAEVPPDMVAVRRSADEKTLFYIDRYEFPGRWGAPPKVGVSFLEARALCDKLGKRLCSYAEWHLACSGEDGRTYPYGSRFRENRCNVGGGLGGSAAPAGFFPKCVTPFGVYDMSGNVSEWVVVPPAGVLAAGGNWTQSLAPSVSCSSSQFHDPSLGWDRVGFRCCLDGPGAGLISQLPAPIPAAEAVPAEIEPSPRETPGPAVSSVIECPRDMISIDRSFCIDRYEYPNQPGETPRALVSWIEAQALCRKAGKRLCSLAEWTVSCGGREKTLYPYGDQYRRGACREGLDRFTAAPAASGSMASCVSRYGVHDMTGNLAEWVADDAGEQFKMSVGGSFAASSQEASCRATAAHTADTRSRHIGFRCCMDLSPGN
ncbi:MAG: SUMF1/EgtB/PvdO family nonheme iron enzyme [Planctomycetes bacterium]|nr:SUMF1/EgtB/PvdO family nonheme iron enzyme [Planctomycetota bacterium]